MVDANLEPTFPAVLQSSAMEILKERVNNMRINGAIFCISVELKLSDSEFFHKYLRQHLPKEWWDIWKNHKSMYGTSF